MAERKWVPVSEVMHREVTEIDGSMTVLDALKTMKQVQATCLIVKRRHERDEYGMLLFSDIAKHVIGQDRAPERVNVYEIMAKPVISVRPEMDIRYCARLFESVGIGHAPVIDETHTVVGIVSYYVLALEALPTLE
ncbi:CBS domain-containing protein [Lentisalinibacter sediminis]|uniref:CBS domain-containing protein n=1 Tax=Lentisalinibacter sediminis TaxID=2992237 RepID=UPI00386E22FC